MKYMSMNRVEIDGEIYSMGRQHPALEFCGFADAADVQRVAAKCSQGTPFMKMRDVAEWFESK